MEMCDGRVILNLLKNERTFTEKANFINKSIKECGKKFYNPKKSGMKTEKTKRRMSGYNCFMKECTNKNGNFQKCLQDKGWGKLSNNEKDRYNNMALEGCN